jgi:hypothetical protein
VWRLCRIGQPYFEIRLSSPERFGNQHVFPMRKKEVQILTDISQDFWSERRGLGSSKAWILTSAFHLSFINFDHARVAYARPGNDEASEKDNASLSQHWQDVT